MNYYKARQEFESELEEDPDLKIWRVILDGGYGVRVDTAVIAHTEDEAIEAGLELVTSMKRNDFDGMAFEIKRPEEKEAGDGNEE